MQPIEVRLSEWLEQGFNLYKNNMATLTVAALLVVLLSAVTLGILAGPLLAGFILMLLRMKDGTEPKPEIGDVFQGFPFFLQTFLFLLVYVVVDLVASTILAVVPLFGFLASLFFSVALGTVALFTMFLIVDKRMDFWPAFMKSFETVKANFWMFLAFNAILQVAMVVGMMLCGVGLIFALPFAYAAVAIAYREIFNGVTEAEVVEPTLDHPARDAGFPPPPTEPTA